MNANNRRLQQQPVVQAQHDHNELSQNESPSEGPGIFGYERLSEMQIATDFIEKIHSLKFTLESDLIGCDAKWTMFVAAALSYRYDTQLKPFPSKFSSEQTGCNIDALVSIINDTPKLRVVLQNILDQNYDEFDTEVLDLLHWVLVVMRDPLLRTVNEEEYDILVGKLEQKTEPAKPTHVFEVCSSLNSRSEESFRKDTNKFSTKLAYHGNKLDSFYSIIHQGFPQSNNNEATDTLLLSTELMASAELAPNGAGWGASSCGSMISCVALCEYVDNPELVETKTETDSPIAHIQITKPNLVRVRYLFFYGSRFPDEVSTKSVMLGWIGRHKYALSLACYTMLLTSIGIANSGSGHYLKHLLGKKATHLLELCKKIFVTE